MNKRVEIDMDRLIGETYFAIAEWHNNEDRLNATEMKNGLVYLSKDIIENVLNTVFEDKERGTEYKNTMVKDTGLLSGLNINFNDIKKGK